MVQKSKTPKPGQGRGEADLIREKPIVTPDVFLRHLLAITPEDSRIIACQFATPPDDLEAPHSRWFGFPVEGTVLSRFSKPTSKFNRYITVSSFYAGEKGYRRRKDQFAAQLVIMIDDVGTKVPFDRIPTNFYPTYALETSPGNFQFWYLLTEPITDRQYAEAIVGALIASGLAKGELNEDGRPKDPGMAGVTRYGRIGGAVNNKSIYDRPFKVTCYRTGGRVNIGDLIRAYEIDPENYRREYAKGADLSGPVGPMEIFVAKNDVIFKFLDSLGLVHGDPWGSVLPITCPWVEDHTGALDDGAAILVNPEGIGFKCHHGSCEHRNMGDVNSWAYAHEAWGDFAAKNLPVEEEPETAEVENINSPIKKKLLTLIEAERPKSDVVLSVSAIAKAAKVRTEEIWPLYWALKTEHDEAQTYQDSDILSLVDALKTGLNLNRVFPAEFADLLNQRCRVDRIDPGRAIQTLLPILASRLGAWMKIHVRSDIYQYPIVFTIDCGYASEGKSETDKIFKAPLITEQQEIRAQEEDIARLLEGGKDETVLPPARRLFSPGGTAEGIMSRVAEQPERAGFVILSDEIAGLVTGADQYKGRSNGNFKNTLLTCWNGPRSPFESEDLKAEENMSVFSHQAISIAGNIQPKRIKHLVDIETDDSGMGSRFLFTFTDLPEDFAVWDESEVDLYPILEDLYLGLSELVSGLDEPLVCTMTAKAKRLYIEQWKHYRETQKTHRELNTALAAYFGKGIGYLPRLALILHSVAVHFGEEKLGVVSARSMGRAIHLMNYYIAQWRLLQVNVAGDGKHLLDDKQIRICKYIEQHPGSTIDRVTAAAKDWAVKVRMPRSACRKAIESLLKKKVLDIHNNKLVVL